MWVTILLFAALVSSSTCIILAEAHPHLLAMKERGRAQLASITSRDSEPEADKAKDEGENDDSIREETLDLCNKVQTSLVKIMQIVLIGCCFGPAVPGLLILMPFAFVLMFCASSWVQSEPTKHHNFGQLLAANIIVQEPVPIIAQLGLPLSWLICLFTMWDLEFSRGAMIFYGFLSAVSLCTFAYASNSVHKLTKLPPDGEQIVWFNPRRADFSSVLFRVEHEYDRGNSHITASLQK